MATYTKTGLGKLAGVGRGTPYGSTTVNSDLVFTSRYGGGNDISIEYVRPAADKADTLVVTGTGVAWSPFYYGDDQYGGWGRAQGDVPASQQAGPPPTLKVTSRKITVTLARTNGQITTTAQQVKATIEADPDASALVTVDFAPGSDGSGVVKPMPETLLTGGTRAAEKTGDRIRWVLDQLGVPESRRDIDDGLYTVQQVEADRGSALTHLRDVAATELGQLFVAANGKVTFHDAAHRPSQPLTATYSDEPNLGADEHLYLTVQPDSGARFVRNVIEVSAPGLNPVTATDPASLDAYWEQSYSHATLLTSQADLQARADAMIAAYKDPLPQITAMKIEATREALAYQNTTAWPAALSLEVSARVYVERNLALVGGGSLLYESFVERIAERVKAKESWSMEVGLSIASLSGGGSGGSVGGGGSGAGTWILDDAANSILDRTTRIG